MVLNSEKKDKFDESTGRCLILSSLVSNHNSVPMLCKYQSARPRQRDVLCTVTLQCRCQAKSNDHAKSNDLPVSEQISRDFVRSYKNCVTYRMHKL